MAVTKSGLLSSTFRLVRYYATERQSNGNVIVGIINKLIILAIILYVGVYHFYMKKGYQKFDPVESVVTSKVRGVVFSNLTDDPIGKRTWDPVDYVVPSEENSAFFVMTNVLVTNKQQHTPCAEDPTVKEIFCTNDTYCQQLKGNILSGSNGPITGKCVYATHAGHESEKVCEIFGWCPVQNEALLHKNPILAGAKKCNVYIKNHIYFPEFETRRRNIPNNVYKNYDDLMECRWNKNDPIDKHCPVFELKTIAEEAGVELDSMTEEGGVLQIVIEWDCNLDKDIEECLPEYSFRRLDEDDITLANAFSFRFASHYNEGQILYRNLYKAYGILFLIRVRGNARKTDWLTILLKLGSSFGLMGIATAACNYVMWYYGPVFKKLTSWCKCWEKGLSLCRRCESKREEDDEEEPRQPQQSQQPLQPQQDGSSLSQL